jgi:hypothetical protein
MDAQDTRPRPIPSPTRRVRLGAAGAAAVLLGALCVGSQATALAGDDTRGAHTGSFGPGKQAGPAEATPFIAKGGRAFRRATLPVAGQRAYDIGAVDYNRDGALDVFTANHMFRDSLLRGDGEGGYTDVHDRMRFSQTPQIPGITSITREPELDEPGVYFFVRANGKKPNLHVRTKDLDEVPGIDGRATGTFTVNSPRVRVNRKQNAEVNVERVNETKIEINFAVRDNANLVIRNKRLALPFGTRFDAPLTPRHIFLGPYPVRAKSRTLPTIELGDRHGAGWGDFNRDGRMDLYMVGGGVSGNLDDYPGLLQDELLLQRGAGFRNSSQGAGLPKGPCRGRESLPADANRDGELDLLVGCREGRPRLYQSTGRGRFRNATKRVKRLGSKGTALRWVDTDNDGGMELVQGGKQSVSVWELGRGGRARLKQRIRARNRKQSVEAIAPGDFNNDGRVDLFIAAPSGNTLLINRDKRLRKRSPLRFGLPGRSTTASWVDFNNDGRLDLHTAPQGLFRAKAKRRFARTGMVRSNGRQRFGRAEWFDSDNDGRRDVAMVVQADDGPSPRVQFFRNRAGGNRRWLELDLIGTRKNREAIGARVTLRAGKRRLSQWVGQSTGSRYSSGHYRLYFGLGRKGAAKRVIVHWPGGDKTRLGRVKANRVKTVRR